MENVTLGQIVASIGLLTIIATFFAAIFKFYKTHFTDKFSKIDKRLNVLEEKTAQQELDIKESKEERLILLRGQLACLKGLHNDLNCNGPVTKGIEDLESYLIKKSHE